MREAIACEFPNLSLLGEGMDHLNDFAKNDYQNLVDIGMIYFSPELIAEKVNNEYYNIEDWWDNVRNNTSFLEFKEKYARPNQSIELLSSIIKKLVCRKKLNKNASNDSGVRANISYGNMLDQERYMYVLGDAIESKVLDCACGIGWGSYLIACAGAKKVISIDLSNSAIKSAKKYYDHENIQYVNGDIFKLKFKNKFDLITSFETIEHLENPQKFLTILKGCSNKNTILYLSTPNGKVFKSKEKPENPYHVNEYTKG